MKKYIVRTSSEANEMLLQYSGDAQFETNILDKAIEVFNKEEEYLETHFEKVTSYSNSGEQHYITCELNEMIYIEDILVDIKTIYSSDSFHWKD